MEEDSEELLQDSEEESSDSEELGVPNDKPEEQFSHNFIYSNHSTLEFLGTKILLILSTTGILVLLPPYMEAINGHGDVYGLILTSTTVCSCVFLAAIIARKALCKKYKDFKPFSLPLGLPRLLQLSALYMACGFLILYALDRKRVLCHLQDPIKGVVLICSLLYYFIFCRKFMGLQRIFSVTTIIVGLFIAVDYGLCNEFKCRGYDRKFVADDNGSWGWKVHLVWTVVYMAGLALFAAYFTLLERYILPANELRYIKNSGSFLSTVSQSISHSNLNDPTTNIVAPPAEDVYLYKRHSSLHLAMWIHIFGLAVAVALFWTDMVPQIGKGSGATEFFNLTARSIICHFHFPGPPDRSACGNVPIFSWLFFAVYVLFVVSSVKFVILSQSAVYTVATMSVALPFVGVWWSLVYMTPKGQLVWSPSVSGEMICSLLGLPIVFIGLLLLCKSHLRDCQWSKVATNQIASSSTNLA